MECCYENALFTGVITTLSHVLKKETCQSIVGLPLFQTRLHQQILNRCLKYLFPEQMAKLVRVSRGIGNNSIQRTTTGVKQGPTDYIRIDEVAAP